MVERIGPRVRLVCSGCAFYERKPFRVQGDVGHDRWCHATGTPVSMPESYSHKTPKWCPHLPMLGQQSDKGER